MSTGWIYPYVRDNSTNCLPDKTPVWTYCTIMEPNGNEPGRYIRLSDYASYTAARPIVTYVGHVDWYTKEVS